MSANTIITSIVTGGTNNHTTVAEEANTIATDFVSQGVVGAITLNTGSGGTGSFCVNADTTADMGVTIKAGQAYISATPASQDSQVLRARASADYTEYTINANSSGVTKYDWIYLSVNATNANVPDAAADNVTSIYTSRSSSNTTDNGTPPTYGLLLAVVTVSNGASSITNSNIADKRINSSIGAQGGSLIVTQAATGDNAIVQAAGQDPNISLQLLGKGTGTVILPNGAVTPAKLAAHYAMGVITESQPAGHNSVTGVGFKPQLVEFWLLTGQLSGDATSTSGAMTANAQWVSAWHSSSSNTAYSFSSTTACICYIPYNSSTPTFLGSYVSMDADGFTINLSATNTWSIGWTAYA